MPANKPDPASVAARDVAKLVSEQLSSAGFGVIEDTEGEWIAARAAEFSPTIRRAYADRDARVLQALEAVWAGVPDETRKLVTWAAPEVVMTGTMAAKKDKRYIASRRPKGTDKKSHLTTAVYCCLTPDELKRVVVTIPALYGALALVRAAIAEMKGE